MFTPSDLRLCGDVFTFRPELLVFVPEMHRPRRLRAPGPRVVHRPGARGGASGGRPPPGPG